uniref:Potassium channel domain-containing protein n=1 Tax=Meloidogyne javanica TaxID=6303 RepID=A0A915LV68_MELJA
MGSSGAAAFTRRLTEASIDRSSGGFFAARHSSIVPPPLPRSKISLGPHRGVKWDDDELLRRRYGDDFDEMSDNLIINETSSVCHSAGAHSLNINTVERRMRPLLSVLSRTHEYDERFTPEAQMWTDSEKRYDHLTPLTDAGRIFTVLYGLLGIPLMFITAADIGKFLSDLVIKTYGKILALFTWLASIADTIRDFIVQPDDESIESSYFALVVGYCAIGSALFNAWERGAVCRDMREAMKIISAMKKIRQPYVPYNVHIFKWIEDAYFQYFSNEDSTSLPSRNSIRKTSPGGQDNTQLQLPPPPPPPLPTNIQQQYNKTGINNFNPKFL